MMRAVVWIPDWPVAAVMLSGKYDPSRGLVVLGGNGVVACNGVARDAGVRVGMRKRRMQSMLEDPVIVRQDEGVEVAAFERVAQAVQEHVPSVAILEPGTLTFFARGAIRAHGSAEELAQNIVGEIAMSVGVEAHVGFAPGLFGAILAARRDLEVASLEPYLDAQPVETLLMGCFARQVRQRVSAFIDSARHLGITKIGDLRALDRDAFVSRFGVVANDVIALIEGDEGIGGGREHEQRNVTVIREPDDALSNVDQAAFLAREMAQEVVAELTHLGVISKEVTIDVTMEDGTSRLRTWSIDATTARDITDRLRWQLSAWLSDSGAEPSSGIARLTITAGALVPAGYAQSTLWGTHQRHAEAAHRAVSRIQSMLGEDAVLVPYFVGGREPGEAYALHPWEADAGTSEHANSPWPGAIPQPWPAQVASAPRKMSLRDQFGHECEVSAMGTFYCVHSCADPSPAWMEVEGRRTRIAELVGPWLQASGWWNPKTQQRTAWCEALDDAGRGVLFYRDNGQWWLRGIYS